MQSIEPHIEIPEIPGNSINNGNNSNGNGNGSSNGHRQMSNQASVPVSDEVKFGLEGLTFDDVLLVPAYSEVLPTDDYISTATYFTRSIPLNVPIISAAMDTVTEGRMAIAM